MRKTEDLSASTLNAANLEKGLELQAKLQRIIKQKHVEALHTA